MADVETTKQRDEQLPRAPRDEETKNREAEHEEEELDEALDETFPASDPVSPSRIDGPNN